MYKQIIAFDLLLNKGKIVLDQMLLNFIDIIDKLTVISHKLYSNIFHL